MKLFKKTSNLLVLALLLSSCGNEQSTTEASPEGATTSGTTTKRYAVVATAAADYSSGAHSVLSYNYPRSVSNDFLPTVSDLAISGYGKYFYRIERFNSNNVTKFSIEDPSTPIWQFSTNEPPITQSNPYGLIFVNDTKAYLLRYGTTKVWIVNPSAVTENEFKIGELDLSAYDDGDGTPEMASGLIVNDRLFIALQRVDMNNWGTPSNPSYIAVFDVATNAEINTGQGQGGLKGIKLDIRNPNGKIKYSDGYIYVPGADNLFGGATYGGIQRVNATTFVPDSNIAASGQNITDVEIASANKGYFILYTAWGNTALKSFDPQTGIVTSGNVAGIGNSGDRNLQDIIADNDGLLWVADGSTINPGIYIIDPSTDTIQEGPLSANLNPLEIAFCEN